MAVYYEARRQYVERKFTRDSQRARLEWLKAKTFMAGAGGVTERKTAVEVGQSGQVPERQGGLIRQRSSRLPTPPTPKALALPQAHKRSFSRPL